MAWIYFQESEESASHSMNGLDPLHIAKSIPTAKVYFYHGCPVETCQKPQSQQIYVSLQAKTSLEILISYTEDSLARTSVLQEMEKVWQESEADCFSKCYVYIEKRDQGFAFWKTYRQSVLEEDFKLLKKLPRWGMTVDGALYQLIQSEQCTKEKDGFYWPTITASQAAKPIRQPSPTRKNKKHGYDLQDRIGEKHPELIGKKINVLFLEWMMGYPLNWTELKPWAMQWFLNKRKKRLKS